MRRGQTSLNGTFYNRSPSDGAASMAVKGLKDPAPGLVDPRFVPRVEDTGRARGDGVRPKISDDNKKDQTMSCSSSS